MVTVLSVLVWSAGIGYQDKPCLAVPPWSSRRGSHDLEGGCVTSHVPGRQVATSHIVKDRPVLPVP
jgi:hypothetical protein